MLSLKPSDTCKRVSVGSLGTEIRGLGDGGSSPKAQPKNGGHKGLSHLPAPPWYPHLTPGEEVGEEMGSILWPQSLGVACLTAGKREFGEISAADMPDNAGEAVSTGHALAC